MTERFICTGKVYSKNASEFIACVLKEYPTHRKHLDSAMPRISAGEMAQMETYISFCLESGLSIPYLAECYLTIVLDTLKEQIYFQKHKKYRHARYEDVAKDVYLNDKYMTNYMYGLALTSYLWPNHLEIFRYFMRSLPRTQKGSYLEIGPGHGANMMHAMQLSSYDSFQGIDISETSVKLTKDIIKYYQPDQRAPYSLDVLDFHEADLNHSKYKAVVMGEVLEHVEQPDVFLKKVAEIASEDAYIFITTCINAPAIDHIHLFRSTAEVVAMIQDCGLKIREELILPYEGATMQRCVAEYLPVNVAYVLGKP